MSPGNLSEQQGCREAWQKNNNTQSRRFEIWFLKFLKLLFVLTLWNTFLCLNERLTDWDCPSVWQWQTAFVCVFRVAWKSVNECPTELSGVHVLLRDTVFAACLRLNHSWFPLTPAGGFQVCRFCNYRKLIFGCEIHNSHHLCHIVSVSN